MESRFGHDFSRVRVHADKRAADSSRAVGALAYTSGRDIVFGAGRYEPASMEGRRLLAHELTHVVQQRSGVHLTNGVGKAGDPYERHADRVAELVTQGRSAVPLLRRMPLRSAQPALTAPVQMQDDAGAFAAPTPTAPEATPAETTAPEEATGEASKAPATTPAPGGKPAKLHLFVDIDVKKLGFTDLMEGDVGHTWVSLEYKNTADVPATINPAHKPHLMRGGKYSDPMGFWPDANIGYSANPFNSYVKGWMRHPDRAHEGAEKATETWDIDQPAVEKVIDYAESKRSAKYSVFFYNCTTFAKQAIEAAGQNAPKMSSWGFCLPNAAYNGIRARQKKGVGQTSVKDFDTGTETSVSGPDEPPKKR